MLYRPMLPDNRDILFSGAVTTSGRPETDLKLIAEVQHLTCFIGGMIGMGAKIFDIETDLELAKRLADGCVWAYESMPSGIMPEGATVIPCESNEHCTWNETAYFHFLDPIADDRDKLIEQYDAKKLAESIAAEIQATQEPKQASLGESEIDDYPLTKQTEGVSTLPGSQAPDSMKSDLNPANEQSSIQKRQSSLEDLPLKDDIVETSATSGKISAGIRDAPEGSDAQVSSGQGALLPEMEMRNVDTSETEAPLSGDLTATPTSKDETQTDPLRPLSHKEFVDARIKQAALPPGFVSIKARKYILRYISSLLR
jgi:mannosyl-oligosaccharide alpha-1,2-mannosidase